MKAFADDKIYVAKKLKFALGRVENIVGKGENVFKSLFIKGHEKSGSCGKELNLIVRLDSVL